MRYNSAGEKFPWGLTDTKRPSSVVERGWRPSTAPIKEAIVGNWRDVRVSSSAFKDRRGPFWVRTPSRKFFTCQDCIKFFFNILSKKLLSKSLYYSVLPISQRIRSTTVTTKHLLPQTDSDQHKPWITISLSMIGPVSVWIGPVMVDVGILL